MSRVSKNIILTTLFTLGFWGQVTSSDQASPPVIETSRPYVVPQLFTLPTAYSLRSFGLRFGGQGNIHSTLANWDKSNFNASIALGLGEVVELGYQLEEFNTAESNTEDILMGWFKMRLIKESPFLPALALSVGQNLRDDFQSASQEPYHMDRTTYYFVASKSFKLGRNTVSLHPGVQVIQDELKNMGPTFGRGARQEDDKINYSLGMSWYTNPKTIFMFETKYLGALNNDNITTSGLTHSKTGEANLGIRYYLRNWLCMDAGVRYAYNLDLKEDDTRLHANFVGVVPLNTLYTRVENFFKD